MIFDFPLNPAWKKRLPIDYILDIAAYFDVRKSWHDVPLSGCDIPVTGIYGRHDMLASNEKECALLKQCFTNMRYHVLEASAHNPHIEETDRVIQICINASGR